MTPEIRRGTGEDTMKQLRIKNCIAALLAALALAGCGTAAPPEKTPEPTPAAETAEPTPLPTPEPTPVPEPEYTGPDLAEQPAVGDEFFADTAFFGNSLVDGLRLYGGLSHGDFYAVQSASVVNVGTTKASALNDGTAATLLQTLAQKQYSRIYILLGINEIGFETSYFIDLYRRMLDQIAESEPHASIYIMGLTPVSKAKSDEGALFSMDRVREYNAALRDLAEERQCWYVDLVDALADADGYLPADQSVDGIHLTADKYPEWADYLRTHYEPDDVIIFEKNAEAKK